MSLHLRRLLLALVLSPFAAQGTIVTTVTDEDNDSLGGGTGVSLREAVKYSPDGDTITFAPALSGQTIRLTLGEILISQSLTIDGSALPNRITLTGDKTGNGKTSDDTRIFKIATGPVVLDSLILIDGYCPTGTTTTEGAGIYVNSSDTQLTVRNSIISNNKAASSGGGIYFKELKGALNGPGSFLKIQKCSFTGNEVGLNGGAINVEIGTLIVEDSTFSSNIADKGSAICLNLGDATVDRSIFSNGAAYRFGGAIYTKSEFTLRSSHVSGNSAQNGGGIDSYLKLTVEASSFSGNSASSSGGGVRNTGSDCVVKNSTLNGNSSANGGGIYTSNGTLNVENSTLAANTGCAILINSGTVNIQHATIVGNSFSVGGGIYRSAGNLSVNKSIVAGNIGSPPLNIAGAYTGSNNLTSGTPLLAPLGDYGGLTQTMPPLPGSPAIDTGSSSSLTTDQRGFPRVGAPDIGAAEYQGASDLTRFWPLDFDGDASPYGTEQALGTDPLISDPANSRNITAPILNASGHPVLTFGIGEAAPGTRWILRRSTDLLTFTEIYRYSGSTDTAVPGVTFLRTATGVTVIDTNPPTGGVFYRFEARLEP